MNTAPMYHYRPALVALVFAASAAAQAQPVFDAQGVATDASTDVQEPRLVPGNNRVIAPPRPAPRIEGAATNLRFESAPVLEVVRAVLGDILKTDYVLHQPISGNVTLATRKPVPPDQAVFLLESALQTNGLVMARDVRGVYHVGRPDVLKSIVPAVRQISEGTLPPGQGAIIVPLQYIGATEMAAILRPLVPAEALLRVDTVRNLLILSGTRSQAEGWMEMVSTFDVNLLQGMSVGVFPLRHVTVTEVEAALKILSPGGAGATGTPTAPATTPARPGVPPATGAAAAAAAAAGTGMQQIPFFGAIRVLPIARINSILVITPRAAYLEDARRWIERLDQPGDNSLEPQLFVYPVQNGSARHLADVLNGIFGDGTQSASGTRSTGTGLAPGLTPTTGSTLGTQGSSLLSNTNRTATAQATNTAGGVSASTLASGVRVVADEVNNAVLIYATRLAFEKIQASIRRLDVPPTQVLIEASIVEVTLTDGLEYGLQWFFNDKSRNGLTGTGVLSTIDGGTLGGALQGFSYTLRNSVGDIRAVLNALADKSLIKVISSPSLMVQDNYTASIVVGTQQPIRSGETVTTGGNVSTTIQYKDTGVNLQVTPSVNAGNIVSMQISQAVTDVGNVDAATGQRSFLQRQISSKVAVRSGEALVLGGLIQDNTTSGKSGIPLLQDIPVVGALFGSNNRSTRRTELLVVITPKVVRNDIDVREVSGELRERMKSFSAVESLFTTKPAQPIAPTFQPPLR